MKKNRRKIFTLVELLVALGVFSILLIVFMQFFSGIRLSWTNSEKRSQVYANVRVAMDMLTQLVSSYYYSSANDENNEVGLYLFRAHQPSDTKRSHKLYFASKTVAELPGRNPIRFIGLQVPTPEDTTSYPVNICTSEGLYNKLVMTVISNEDRYFSAFFPPFLKVNATNGELGAPGPCSEVINNLSDLMNGSLKLLSNDDSPARIDLLNHVTSFKVRIFDAKGDELSPDGSRNIDNVVPAMIEITLSVLSGDDFTAWTEMKGGVSGAENAEARRFREKNELVFNRRIYIGTR